MIRSVPTSLRFANTGKRAVLNVFLEEYRRVVRTFVERYWDLEKLSKFGNSACESWLSARAKQCAAKQAMGIVRGLRRKHDARKYIIDKLQKSGDMEGAKRLQRIQETKVLSFPEITNISAELDSRFVKIGKGKGFDLWLTLLSLGNSLKIILPLKKTKIFNKWERCASLKSSVRIDDANVTFYFEKTVEKKSGNTVGIDVGLKKTFSTSEGVQSCADVHGHTLESICKTLIRKKKGSKGYRRAQRHRRNHIRWCVNRLNLENVGTVKLEKIKNLRRGKRCSKVLSRWSYRDIFAALLHQCENLGVQVSWVNPANTSRRCGSCGWTEKSNRSGEKFRCKSCGHTTNADLNAAQNILACPILVEKSRREFIVPAANIKSVE